MTATAVAETLVELGVAFRSAHHVVGRLVRTAEVDGLSLEVLSDDAVTAALRESDDESVRALAGDPTTAARLRAAASIEGALARCNVIGGTAPSRVADELAAASRRLGLA